MAENVNDSPSPPQKLSWVDLPLDLTANILQRLNVKDILVTAQNVCTTWRKVCLEPTMWRVVDLECPDQDKEREAGQSQDSYSLLLKFLIQHSARALPWQKFLLVPGDEKYYIMCCCAVDRSQGQLIELTISGFGDDKLLDYIGNRASNIKCLTLRGCYDMNGLYLTEVIKKLPDLEELHLTNMPYVTALDVRAIGPNCPKFRSFSYNERGALIFFDDIDCALAISESMPNLRHLRLGTPCIQDYELEAILDGCPHLESLDIGQCCELDVREDLEKRCRRQIQDLRLPFNSASDIQDRIGLLSGWDDLLVDDFD